LPALKINTEYAASFGAYWMIYAIAGSFASVFMLAKGYSNMQIGMTLSAANLLALALQPFIADHADVSAGIRIIDSLILLTLVMMLTGCGFFAFSGGSLLLAAVFVIILAIHAVLQPLLNTLAFRLSESGTKVSFSIGRAGGSLGFSLILAVLGTLIEKRGVMAVPVCTEATCALFIALLLILKRSFIRLRATSAKGIVCTDEADPEGGRRDETERIDLRDFIRRNRIFFIMNLGIAGLFYSNFMLTNYMAQIAGNVGGTTEQIGRILSLMAFAEMPTMFFFDGIRKHFSGRTLLKAAALGFTAKIVICWLGRSVGILFAAQAFQLVAFALFMPAMVYYTDEIMSPGEAVKGQALFTMMIVFSSIIAGLTGGWILDTLGVRALTGISALVTSAGAAVVIMTVDKVKSHRKAANEI